MVVGWPIQRLVLLLLPIAALQVAYGQFIFYNGDQQLGTNPYCAGNITLNNTNWSTPPVITDRTLILAGDVNTHTPNVLDFGGLLGALVIGDGAEVEFRNLTLAHPGPQNISGATTNHVNYRSTSVGIWPSLIVLNGSRVFFNDSLLYYYSQIEWSRCANFVLKIQYELRAGLHVQDVRVNPANNASLVIPGFISLMSNISDINTNATVGMVELLTENTTMTCIDSPYVQDASTSGAVLPRGSGGGGGFKWWYGLIIALGALVFLAAAAAIALAVVVRRHRRARAGSDQELGPKGLSTGSRSASEDQKPPSMKGSSSAQMVGAPSMEFLGAPQGGVQAQVEPLSSVGAASASARSDPGAREPEAETAYSGGLSSLGKGSGVASESGFSWADVTALLRARSDFSDVEVGPLIGRGSFGRVYKGRWKGAFVAIKIVDHQEAASKVIAMREGTLSHSVQHPNVITTYSVFLQRMQPTAPKGSEDWDGDDGASDEERGGDTEGASPPSNPQEHFATCLLLEYADRGTLEKAVMSGRFRSKTTGECDFKAIHRTLLDIAGGMDYLHSVGVLHGDLKGANVLLKSTATDPRGFSCKLADFGMARVLDTNRTHVSTQTYGTISYMPAELLKDGKLTRSVDSYSFAILMWELFSGGMLHSGLTMAQVFYKICYEHAKPPIPDWMPAEYSSLMVRCWDDDPTKRPSFSEIFEHLQSMPNGRAATRPSFSTSLGSPSRKGSESPPLRAALPTPAVAAERSRPASPLRAPLQADAVPRQPQQLESPDSLQPPQPGEAGTRQPLQQEEPAPLQQEEPVPQRPAEALPPAEPLAAEPDPPLQTDPPKQTGLPPKQPRKFPGPNPFAAASSNAEPITGLKQA